MNATRHMETGCLLRQTSRLNALPPVISCVCRESRAVALEHGGLLLKDGAIDRKLREERRPDELFVHGLATMTRFVRVDRRRDVVHLNWYDMYDEHAEALYTREFRLDQVPLWLAAAGRAQGASLTPGLFETTLRKALALKAQPQLEERGQDASDDIEPDDAGQDNVQQDTAEEDDSDQEYLEQANAAQPALRPEYSDQDYSDEEDSDSEDLLYRHDDYEPSESDDMARMDAYVKKLIKDCAKKDLAYDSTSEVADDDILDRVRAQAPIPKPIQRRAPPGFYDNERDPSDARINGRDASDASMNGRDASDARMTGWEVSDDADLELDDSDDGYSDSDSEREKWNPKIDSDPDRVRGKALFICYRMVCIHAPFQPAVDSGLFGLLGEERVKLVSAYDTDQHDRYRAFWEAHGRRPDRNPYQFFHKTRPRKEEIDDRVTYWELIYLIPRWQVYHDSIPNAADAWERKPADCHSTDWEYAEQERVLANWTMNSQHPWVVETLPRIRPTVMFRLCTDDCWDKADREFKRWGDGQWLDQAHRWAEY